MANTIFDFKPISSITPRNNYWENGTWKFNSPEITAGSAYAPSYIDIILSGVSVLTLVNAKANGLNYLKLYGKCEQNGTPTPSSPVDIVCNNGVIKVKDDELPAGYRRLTNIIFDGNTYYNTNQKLYGNDVIKMNISSSTTSGQNLFGAYAGTGSGVKNLSLYVYFSNSSDCYLRYNEQLIRPNLGTGSKTISFGNGSTSGFRTDKTFTAETFETDTVAWIGALPNSSSPKFNGKIGGNIEIGSRLKYIPVERESDNAIGYYESANGVFIENSGTGTPSFDSYDTSHLTEIYYDGTVETVEITGKNLFNPATTTDGFINASGQVQSSDILEYSALIPVVTGQTYTWSGTNNNSSSTNKRLHGYDSNGNWVAQLQTVAIINATYSVTATIPSGVTFVRLSGIRIDTPDTNVMLEQGSTATTYEPYYNGGTATAQPLLKVGDYKDVQEVLTGEVTRNVGIYLLDGTENWQATGTSFADGSKRYYFNDDGYSMYANTGELCTHFVQSPLANRDSANQTGHFFSNQNSFHIRIPSSLASDVTTLKSWLKGQFDAGTPVIFTYPLATPTTESVTAQPLTIQAGTNVVEITQASIDNLELEVSYKAGVEVTVEEIEAVNNDESVEVTING